MISKRIMCYTAFKKFDGMKLPYYTTHEMIMMSSYSMYMINWFQA
jgi:hypothetical protein